jgi:serine/threonine-protein phosphatase 2A regulatory subunit B''
MIFNTGMLSKSELAHYSHGSLTSLFLTRVWEECRTYKNEISGESEMDYKTFLDFTLAIENKRTPQALRWFFKILDIDKCGFINVETIRLFFRCVMDRMVDIDYSAADVIDEIFDMVKPKRKDRITLKDLIDSGVGHTIVSILIDVNGFWAYDNRETLIAGPLNDDGNIDNTFGNISLNH